MKKIVCLLALALLAAGCGVPHFGAKNKTNGSGTPKVEKRAVGPFTAVDISGAYDVEIVAQKETSLEIEGDDNLLKLVKTEVKNGTLFISSESGFSTRRAIRVRISTPDIQGLTSSGANQIKITGVKSENFVVETSGASKIFVAGEAKTVEIEMSGATRVDASELRAARAKVSSSGASRASVYATEEVNADLSGASNVTYYGAPKTVNKEVSGASSVDAGAPTTE